MKNLEILKTINTECYDNYELKNGNCYDLNNIRNIDSTSILSQNNNNQTTYFDINNYNFKYFYEINEYIVQIKNTYTNYTFFDLKYELLITIKNIFNLEENEKIYMIINDYPSNKTNKATNDYDYRLVLENGTELNKNEIKEDLYTDFYIPIAHLGIANYNYTKFFAEKGYDIYDKNSFFYKDICSPAYIGKPDIVIKNRKKYIYPNNVTLC